MNIGDRVLDLAKKKEGTVVEVGIGATLGEAEGMIKVAYDEGGSAWKKVDSFRLIGKGPAERQKELLQQVNTIAAIEDRAIRIQMACNWWEGLNERDKQHFKVVASLFVNYFRDTVFPIISDGGIEIVVRAFVRELLRSEEIQTYAIMLLMNEPGASDEKGAAAPFF